MCSNKRLLEMSQFLFWIECDFRWLQTLFQFVSQIITIHRDVFVSISADSAQHRLEKLANHHGPVGRSMVIANHWLRGIETCTFLWQLTLVSVNHASSNSGQKWMAATLVLQTNPERFSFQRNSLKNKHGCRSRD